MCALEILFWFCIALVGYTYVGYGFVLGILVTIKRKFTHHAKTPEPITEWPDVTLLICAYNEERVVNDKMQNCLALTYPKDKLHILWVTDGSNDRTNELLAAYPDIQILHRPERCGKTAALNHGMSEVHTPFTLFTDANTFINPEAVTRMVTCFLNSPKVGCVAGEKRIISKEQDNAAGGGEGIYWKYESTLKRWDSELFSAMGAAGELFGIRTELWQDMSRKVLLDDFYLSMRIVEKGYTIAYCSDAYAMESGSKNMDEEAKRKERIAAGGVQSISMLSSLLNPIPHPLLTFQYVSHRVLRWSITPIALFALIPLNVLLVFSNAGTIYTLIWIMQCLFYIAAYAGYVLSTRQIKNKLLYIPYYFMFMNVNVLNGFRYLHTNRHTLGVWAKAERA